MRLAYVQAGPEPQQRRLGAIDAACKCWRCEGCGRRLRQLHGQLIAAGFAEHVGRRGEPFARFLTVTWPTDTGARIDSAADCAHTSAMFRRFVRDVRASHTPRLEYYVVKEPTRRGRLHLHAVTFGPYLRKCRRTLPGAGDPCHRPGGCQGEAGRRPCVQAIAHRLGLGWVDIRVVRGERHAAAYIGKYLGKDHIGRRWPRHSRRASYSHDFAPTTIGRLGAAWSERAYTAGVAAGHIQPREPQPAGWETTWHLLSDLLRRGPPVAYIGWPAGHQWALDLEAGTVRHLGTTVTADLDTGEIAERPWLDLSESAWLRRMNQRTEDAARELAAPDDLADPYLTRHLYAVARQRAYTEAGLAAALR